MKYISLIVLFLLTSCGQDYNSNSFDRQRYGNTGIDNTTPFGKAFNVIQTNCINCHTGYHNIYSNYTTSQAWVNSGLVKANDFAGSPLIIKLINYGGNMPQGGSQLGQTEINYLNDWITNL
ncbi:MAG: hypothetical protein EP326_15170 [Deltaproteobacteria bacterium]|nr:MAG: hypothetical protein EP326_15170 [Deltaproteobacteria bacterium]